MSRHLGVALTAFVDGELEHAARDQVMIHLAHCADCRAELALLRGLKDALRGEPRAPEDLASRILASRILASATQQGQPVMVSRPAVRSGLLSGHSRLRRTAFGLGALALGVGGALAAAGPPPTAPRAPVDPTSAGFLVEHISTAHEVPFAGTAVVPAANPLPSR